MPDQIQPALTPEEWERVLVGEHHEVVIADMEHPTGHATAALALHGQPFGFRHEDVDDIRWAEERDLGGLRDRWATLADRIAALLPPREP